MSKIIITTGGSQLLTQIACLRKIGHSLTAYEVYYLGLEVKELNEVLTMICTQFKMVYKGRFPDLPLIYPINRKNFYKFETIKRLINKKYLLNFLFQKIPLLHQLKGKELVVPFRNKVIGDVFLLAALEPKSIILTADGVIDKINPRNVNNWRWYGIKTIINQIPVTGKIYTPSYLALDTKKISAIEVIPDKVLYAVFNKVASTTCIQAFKTNLTSLGKPKSIIFSQHLALTGVCDEKLELKLYKAIIFDLIKKKVFPIVFKPHPRETEEKIKYLKKEFSAYADKILFLNKEAQVIPIEIIYALFKNSPPTLVTLSSSAPLSITHASTSNMCVYDAPFIPNELRREISTFAKRYNCETRLLEA